MYTKTARYYDSYYAFRDNGGAMSRNIHRLIQMRHPSASSLLDLGCGTGKTLKSLSSYYHVEGLDIQPEMLDVARRSCPNTVFHLADMANFNIGRRFDVITSIFNAIGYVKTHENLQRTLQCISKHLNPGGLVLIEPWFTPSQYWTGTITGHFVDEPDLKIAWMHTSERHGLVSVLDMHYMVGTKDGIEEFRELHEMGLFTDEQYENAFRNVGLSVEYDPDGVSTSRGLYLGMAPNRLANK